MATPKPRDPVAEALADDARIEAAFEQAERETLLRHKRLGQPIVVWRDGKVVHVPPEEIEVDNGEAEKENEHEPEPG